MFRPSKPLNFKSNKVLVYDADMNDYSGLWLMRGSSVVALFSWYRFGVNVIRFRPVRSVLWLGCALGTTVTARVFNA